MTEQQFNALESYIDAKIAFARMSVKERGEVLAILDEKRRRALNALTNSK